MVFTDNPSYLHFQNGKPDDSSSSVDKERTFSGSAATTANR